MLTTAKIFNNGGSQAIRLPKEFRFDVDEVYISKRDKELVIKPKPKMTWKKFFETHDPVPDFSVERDNSDFRPIKL